MRHLWPVTLLTLFAALPIVAALAQPQRDASGQIQPVDFSARAIGNGWARFEFPGWRTVFERPANVKGMTVYDPGTHLENVNGFSVYLNFGPNDEIRIDCPTEQRATELVNFILDNDGRGDPIEPQTRVMPYVNGRD